MYIPRLLFPYNFQSTDGNKISGQVAPSDYYYYDNNVEIGIDTHYDKWVEKVLTKYSPESIRSYEGHITDLEKETTIGTNKDIVGEKAGTTF